MNRLWRRAIVEKAVLRCLRDASEFKWLGIVERHHL